MSKKPTVYEARHRGKAFCNTEGSEHYKSKDDGVEPIDLMISIGVIEGFCLGNIIKYAARYKKTQDVKDLNKAIDYAHIICGVKLDEMEGEEGEGDNGKEV